MISGGTVKHVENGTTTLLHFTSADMPEPRMQVHHAITHVHACMLP